MDNNINNRRRLQWILVIMVVLVGLDQVSKSIAYSNLRFMPPKIYLGDFFRLQYAENTGAMLGFGSMWNDSVRFWVLTILPATLLTILVGYLLINRKLSMLQSIALALIGGGGVSNIYDRIYHDGRVIDFMNMGFGSLRTGIFNFADVGIMVGMGLIILSWWTEEQAVENKPAIQEIPGEEAEGA